MTLNEIEGNMFHPNDFVTLRTLIAILAGAYLIYRFSVLSRPRIASSYPELENVIYEGTVLVADGVSHFPDWSAAMLREYHHLREESLDWYFEVATSIGPMPKESWRSMIQQTLADANSDQVLHE